MRSRGTFALVAGCLALACSSKSASVGPVTDAGIDAPIGPIVCGVPMAGTCPAAAPCAYATWGCTTTPCQGYLVAADATWTYYYSAYGQELVGVTAVGDAGIEACPYGFEPPQGCAPTPPAPCTGDAGP